MSRGKKKSSCAFRLTKSRTVVISPIGLVLPIELFMGPYQIVRLFLRLRFGNINRGMDTFFPTFRQKVPNTSTGKPKKTKRTTKLRHMVGVAAEEIAGEVAEVAIAALLGGSRKKAKKSKKTKRNPRH